MLQAGCYLLSLLIRVELYIKVLVELLLKETFVGYPTRFFHLCDHRFPPQET